jgi:hypothetical protein
MLSDRPIKYNEEQQAERPFIADIVSHNKTMKSAGLEPMLRRV